MFSARILCSPCRQTKAHDTDHSSDSQLTDGHLKHVLTLFRHHTTRLSHFFSPQQATADVTLGYAGGMSLEFEGRL
ncbi:hypothetical protein NQZ68_010831 [Dissostichus eleginoides]|nr:hypothetical protein NQZ68_010831 [Dissostichus eleginoides]